MPFAGVGIFFEGKNLLVSVVFVKCGRLKRKLASDSLAPELFTDEKILDAEPIAKCLSCQSSELLARLILQKYTYRDALGCLAVTEIVFLQQLVDLMDIARISITGDSKRADIGCVYHLHVFPP